MQEVVRLIVSGMIILFIPICVNAQLQYQGESNIQLLYGEDVEPAKTDLATFTFEHAGSYGSLEHFGFIDVSYDTDNEDTGVYTEWFPKVSLGRIGGQTSGDGFLGEVLLGGGINADLSPDSDFLVWLSGLVWQFRIPGIDFFQLETYYYRQKTPGEKKFAGTYQITPSWDTMLPVGENLQFRFRGFVDFIGAAGPGEEQIIAQPQFLLDLGRLWDNPEQVYAGTEWRYWYNKGGVEGVTESVFQVELLVEL